MKRYQKLQRRIRDEQEDFLNDVVTAAGLKVCLDPQKPPEGQSVLVDPESYSESGSKYNWKLTPCFAVPVYMSVNRQSPTYKERSAQEKESIRAKLIQALAQEGILMPLTLEPFTDDVVIHVQV